MTAGPVLANLPAAYAADPLLLVGNNGLRITAPLTNVDSNDRLTYQFNTISDSLNCEVRSTWFSQDIPMSATNAYYQQGHAHRIKVVGGSNFAVTLTKNIVFAANWVINAHTWDSSNLVTPYTAIGNVHLDSYLNPGGVYTQLPWHMKSRVNGTTIEFAIWIGTDPEPAYGAAGQSGSFTIPAPYDTLVGAHGIYAGHLSPGQSMTFTDISIGGSTDLGAGAIQSRFLTRVGTDDYVAEQLLTGPIIAPNDPVTSVFYAEALNHDGTGLTHWDTFKWDIPFWSDPGQGQWTDIVGRIRGLTWTRGCQSPLDRPRVGTATITLDNRDGAVSPWTAGEFAWLRPGTVVRFGAYKQDVPGTWTPYPFFTGIVETMTESSSANTDAWSDLGLIETTGILGAWNGLQQPATGAGDTLSGRLNRLLNDAGWPCGLIIDSDSVGDTATFQDTTMAQNRLAELYLTVDSVGMRLLAGSDGKLRLTSPYPPVAVTSANRFSNNPMPGDLPLIGVKIYTSRDRLVNVAIASRAGGTQQIAQDTVSISKYGRFDPGGSRNDLIVQSDTTVAAELNRQVFNGANDIQGVESVDLDADMAASLPGVMVGIASKALEARVPFNIAWTHPSGNVYASSLVVDGMTHSIAPVAPGVAMKWTTTLSTATRIITVPLVWDVGHWDITQWANA